MIFSFMSTEIKVKADAFECVNLIKSLDDALASVKDKNVIENLTEAKKRAVEICKPKSKNDVIHLMHATSAGIKDPKGEFLMAAGVPWNEACLPDGKVFQRKNRDGKEIVLACQSKDQPTRKGKRKDEVVNYLLASVRYHPELYTIRKIRGKDEWKVIRMPEQWSTGKPDESTWIKKFGPLVYDDGFMRFKDIAEARKKGEYSDVTLNTPEKYFL